MGDYFKPWRRKVGILTLVLAFLFMAGWMRSKCYVDLLYFGTKHAGVTKYSLVSSPDELSWMREEGRGSKPTYKRTEWSQTPVNDGSSHGITALLTAQYQTIWQWQLLGFDYAVFGTNTDVSEPGIRIAIVSIRHWSLVIPLTLLSAWLLLFSKLRKPTSNESTEPTPDKEA